MRPIASWQDEGVRWQKRAHASWLTLREGRNSRLPISSNTCSVSKLAIVRMGDDVMWVVNATGASNTATDSLRAREGWLLSAASAIVVPCEWPTYPRRCPPVWRSTKSTIAGRSCAAMSSQLKSQKASEPVDSAVWLRLKELPRTLPIQTSNPASASRNPRLWKAPLLTQLALQSSRACCSSTAGLPDAGLAALPSWRRNELSSACCPSGRSASLSELPCGMRKSCRM
mmetsp:Transcript_38966/g.99656  ORF Transcript_38966/g.99656 Transcript_38966/m.99656 type:complete len:228 (-) Transcript_38966:403-1086(-)